MGWRITHAERGDWIVHAGDNDEFHAFVAASLAQKAGYVIMTNGENGVEVIKKVILGETVLNWFVTG